MGRRWLHRIVVIVGAIACIATPQKKWFRDAQLSPDAKDTTRERILVVSASREPEVWVKGQYTPPIQRASTWPGTVQYRIPAGAPIDRVQINKGCGGGCKECVPGPDEYVRIDRVDRTSWTIEAPPQNVTRTIGNRTGAPRALITLEATRQPELFVDRPQNTTALPTVVLRGWKPPIAEFALEFAPFGDNGVTYVWPVRARITGPCADAMCQPPVGSEYVKILKVADE